MLTDKSTEIIRATLPAVGAAIGEITPLFYQRMFAAHPDLEKNLFNRGNQAQGDQQRALAGAIAAYATLLVDEQAPAPTGLLARIAHKHASLGVIADQYKIVHKYLFEAIVTVLGEAVTADVAAAWDEVYWLMANELIATETQLYAEAGVSPDQLWRELVVRRRVQQSPDSVSFFLADPDGASLPPARPGQYISVAVTLSDGARQIRQYSLTSTPSQQEWAITVKAIAETPAGEVSNFLHRNVFEDDRLTVSPPFGDLVLRDGPGPLLLISAGIGCTPIIGMLHHLVATDTGRHVTALHADRSPARHAHRQELSDLVSQLPGARLHHWYEDLGVRPPAETTTMGRIDLESVDIDPDSQVYMCGPLPFMDGVRAALTDRGMPESSIHYEVFGPDTWLVTT